MLTLGIGPDAMVLVYALIVSLVVAVLTWRQVPFAKAAVIVIGVALVLVTVQYFALDRADVTRELVRASFIVVPSALLLATSRVRWLARHAWTFVVAGPLAFAGCYVGICEICVHANLI